jgi:predicted ArsR family transcriptional regulator
LSSREDVLNALAHGPATAEDVAERVGMQIETVKRVICELEREGMLMVEFTLFGRPPTYWLLDKPGKGTS